MPFYHSGLADILPKGSMVPRPGVFAMSMAIHTALCVALYNALFTAFCTVFKYIWYLGSRPHLKAEHM